MISCGVSSPTANHEQQKLLQSLRTLLLSASQHSASVVCHSLSNICSSVSICSMFYGNAESITSLSSALNMTLSCLRALSVWGSANFSSLPDFIESTDRETTINQSESTSSTLISLRLMLSGSSSSSTEGSYFETFLQQLRYCLRVFSYLNSSNESLRSSLGEDGIRGLVNLSSQMKEAILLSLGILSEWLLVTTPFIDVSNHPSMRDSQHHQLVVHQQGEAVRMCQSIYSVYLIIIETWDVLLRCDGGERGILQWRHALDEHSLSCTDRTCCSVSALEGAGVTSYGTGTGAGVNDGTLDPDSFLNALIGLTVAFAERHLVRTWNVNATSVCVSCHLLRNLQRFTVALYKCGAVQSSSTVQYSTVQYSIV
jgi:hypothetical protein